ncbi:TPA: ABC transporter ATP-binding protein [Streptococcus pneumoniae]|uniref:ABC transporter ATP-binding protein n=1 Tax=Streptococcus pneumoniae TaxID=1313 RepID=UPI00135EA2FB|nr:ABC transporter ATP-binding protein [Streptococcus pneumoniae]MDV8175646.1 ABC transporter ATP-binding protein/permease [Streptococcus pneumoniae]MTV56582.1 ATP-binding cassette domain-containing protein [Streptococcus pneumoniae]MTW30262.1 ATP-binding cassette domain-containing protein [Streptococcus pneumoniae]HEW7963428.1 ABC transporter ATP-binding protein [Streptococcus pneumoniae]HEW8929951.1 ABC transporter ATP-binding protein [Streptococcus pneumoniae]
MYTIIKSNIKKFSLLTIFIVAGQLLLIYAATINALVLNELIAMNLERFLKLSIYQMIVWCGIIFLDWVVKNYQVEVIQEFNLEIRNRVATDISNSTYQEFHSKSSGTYLSWLNNDVQTLNDQAFKQLFLVIKGISGTIFAVVTLNHYHWSLTVATLFSLMIMLLVPKIFASKMREVSLNLTNQNEAFLKSSETILNGFDVLASLNLLYVLPKKIKEAGILLKMVIQRKTTVETLAGAISFFLNIFFQISLVFLTGYLAIKGIVKIGTKPIFLKLYSINPIESNKMNDIEPNEVNRDFPLYEAKNICYKYGDKEILKNLNFCFQRNEKYLILGESGSGKSTLLKLLNGFLRDYSGELRFCGDDIKKTSYLNMVSNVLYVDQKAYLFEGTIRDNILLEENYTDEEILQSLEQVGLSVKDFPNNILDYYVGDDGRLLSGGQKQKITLARGLIRNKRIVLIDEGTSAIDRRTSLAIERKILDREDLTVIIVTHAPHPELKQYFTKIYQFPKDFI